MTAARVPEIAGVPPDRRRAIVVGASSGIGAATVRQLAREGYAVAALARREEHLASLAAEVADEAAAAGGRVVTRAHDVSRPDDVPALFEELVRELGGLDLLVYAAGIMPSVEADQYDTELDRAMIEVNLVGLVAWTNPTATLFQTQRDGTIVGISSIAGDRGRKKAPVYGTTKAAMDHYLESLRNRLAGRGVHVCTIKPGFVATAMTEGLEGLFWVVTPEEVARQSLLAARNRVTVRYVPLRWQAVGLAIRSIPSFLFRHLNV